MKKAAAISYKGDMNAPKVTAKGSGYVADNIIREANEKQIPVYEDSSLATLLTEVEIGQQIPSELYDLVAEILVFVGDLDELYERINPNQS